MPDDKCFRVCKAIQEKLHEKDQNQTEFLQAIDDFLPTIIPFLEKHPEYIESNWLIYSTEPERFDSISWCHGKMTKAIGKSTAVIGSNLIMH